MGLFLKELEAAISGSTNRRDRAERVAERACYLARIGRIGEAKESLSDVRSEFPSGASARVSVRLMLAEAHIMYFESLSDRARDRANRAYEVSKALGLSDLRQATAAWLAHIELDRSNYSRAVSLVLEALSGLSEFKGDVLIRSALVLGDAYLLAGNRTSSQAWYQLARSAALIVGDQAAIGAVMYNRGAFGLTWQSVQDVLHDGVKTEDTELIALELHSSAAFHYVARITALEHLSHLFRARAMLVEGRTTEALEILTTIRDSVGAVEDRERKSPLLADMALCLACAGKRDEVLEILGSLTEQQIQAMDADDKVVFVGRLIRAARLIDQWTEDHWLSAALVDARAQYEQEMASLGEALDQIAPVVLGDMQCVVASTVGAL